MASYSLRFQWINGQAHDERGAAPDRKGRYPGYRSETVAHSMPISDTQHKRKRFTAAVTTRDMDKGPAPARLTAMTTDLE